MSSSVSPRTPVVDLIKALACLAIVAHHLAFYGPMSDTVATVFPETISWLYDQARMAVQVFLVLGGFLAAMSLAPEGRAAFAGLGSVIRKRYLRLITPYIAALLLTVLVAEFLRPWFHGDSLPAEPSIGQGLAHVLLLQSVLAYESLSAGVWYVAIDFQLFLVTAGLFAALRHFSLDGKSTHAALPTWGQFGVVLGVAASLWGFNRFPELDAWFIYFFGAYGLGILAWWASQSPNRRHWLLLMALLSAVGLWLEFRERIAVAAVTALILGTGVHQSSWSLLNGGVTDFLQKVGQRSYSIFLIHFPVCLLVNAVFGEWFAGDVLTHALGMVLAMGLSLWAGDLFYRWVERPSPSWSTWIRLQSGLAGAILLSAWVQF